MKKVHKFSDGNFIISETIAGENLEFSTVSLDGGKQLPEVTEVTDNKEFQKLSTHKFRPPKPDKNKPNDIINKESKEQIS